MKNPLRITAGVMIGIAFLLTSCLEELEKLDKIEKSAFEPTIDLPIINSQFNMEEMLTKGKSKARISTKNGVLVLIYDDKLVSPEAGEFFFIPDQESPDIEISGAEIVFSPSGTFQIEKSIAFPFADLNGESLDSILIKSGQLVFSATSSFPADVEIAFEIPSLIVGGQTLKQSVNLSGPGTESSTKNLGVSTLDMTDGGNSQNVVQFKITATVTSTGAPIDATQSLTCSFTLSDLNFRGLFGDLGSISFPIDADSIKVDLFNNTFDGNFTLLSPAIQLELKNSFGLPISFDIQRLAAIRRDGSSVSLTGSAVSDPHLIDAPGYTEIGESKLATIDINSSTSNLANLVSSLPSYLAYQFDLGLNPGDLENHNFVLDTSKLEVGVHLELPFHGQVSELSLTKRFDFGGLGVDDIDEASVKLKTVNESPLDMAVQVYFVDAGGTVLDSLFQNPSILKGAPVDGDGYVTSPATVTMNIPITPQDIQRIEQAEFIDVAASVFTTNNGTVPVKVSIADKLTMSLGVHVKLKYNIN